MPRTVPLLLCCIAFGLAYGQAPLYYSNQNQYFLKGLAQAGVGTLNEDWLANTADPTPLFSFLVANSVRFLHPYVFHLYYLILQGVYLASLVAVFGALARSARKDRQEGQVGEVSAAPLPRLAFALVLIATHCAFARWASNRLFGLDIPWYLQAGLAGQYILGGIFQPSTFGVFLVGAVALFLNGRRYVAAALVCATATMHFTYALPAGLLTAGFIAVVWRESGWKQAALLGSAALALVAPIILFVALRFRPTSAEAFAEAQHILVHFRIPHHSLPQLWLDGVALAQIGWLVLGTTLAYGSRLFLVLAVPILLAACLTVAQVVTQSDTLALFFPWRVSAVLMPLATAVIFARIVLLFRGMLTASWIRIAAGAGIAGLAAAGIVLLVLGQGFRSAAEDEDMMNFVKANTKSKDVYLLPMSLPNLKATTRGSRSSDFRRVEARRADRSQIPMDLQRFRLFAQAPIYVDFKAIPYRDLDVIEWRRRLDRNVALHERFVSGDTESARAEMLDLGITHVVIGSHQKAVHPEMKRVFNDEDYQVFQLTK